MISKHLFGSNSNKELAFEISTYGTGSPYPTVITSSDGDLYGYGFRTTSGHYSDLKRFDMETKQWIRVGGYSDQSNCAGVSHKGYLYFYKGYGNSLRSHHVRYHIVGNKWESIATTSTDFDAHHIFGLVWDNHIYYYGGIGRSHLRTMFRYSIETNTITRMADAPQTAYGYRCAVVNGKLYYFDGDIRSKVLEYNIDTDTWRYMPYEFPYVYYYRSAITYEGRILMFYRDDLMEMNMETGELTPVSINGSYSGANRETKMATSNGILYACNDHHIYKLTPI